MSNSFGGGVISLNNQYEEVTIGYSQFLNNYIKVPTTSYGGIF